MGLLKAIFLDSDDIDPVPEENLTGDLKTSSISISRREKNFDDGKDIYAEPAQSSRSSNIKTKSSRTSKTKSLSRDSIKQQTQPEQAQDELEH